MIKKHKIKNYQSHKNTELEYVPGVNIIIGESDKGKSSIYRNFRWGVWNKPSKVSRWCKKPDTESLLEFDNGVVHRKKISKFDGYNDEFKALRGSVPDEIKNIHNLSEINFQSQHDSHFLITETPGNVAKKLNEIVDLEVIDSSVKAATSNLNSIEKSIKSLESDIENDERELEGLKWIDYFENLLQQQSDTSKSIFELIEKINSLDEILDDLFDIDTQIGGFKESEKLIGFLTQAVELDVGIETKKAFIDNLSHSIENVKNINEKLDVDFDFELFENFVSGYQHAGNKILGIDENYDVLRSLCKDLNFKSKEETSYQITANELQESFESQFPDVCPLCGAEQ